MSSTYNNVATDDPTTFTIPLMATANSITAKLDPCGTPFPWAYCTKNIPKSNTEVMDLKEIVKKKTCGSQPLRFQQWMVLRIPCCQVVSYAFSRLKNKAMKCWCRIKAFADVIPGSPGGQGWIYNAKTHTEQWRDFSSPRPWQDDSLPCAPLSCRGNYWGWLVCKYLPGSSLCWVLE